MPIQKSVFDDKKPLHYLAIVDGAIHDNLNMQRLHLVALSLFIIGLDASHALLMVWDCQKSCLVTE